MTPPKKSGLKRPIKAKIELSAVFWQDAYITQEEDPELEGGGQQLTLSVGKITREDKDFIYVSHFYDGIGGAWESPWTIIPKGMIRKRKDFTI